MILSSSASIVYRIVFPRKNNAIDWYYVSFRFNFVIKLLDLTEDIFISSFLGWASKGNKVSRFSEIKLYDIVIFGACTLGQYVLL